MMLALGYQESRLNQAAVQSGGRDRRDAGHAPDGPQMNVGDIRQLEPNIHAGIKYMHHLMGVYFPTAPQDMVNRTCSPSPRTMPGPTASGGCAGKLRTAVSIPMSGSTTSRSWRRRRSAAETVTYVSNIFKYYVAYRLLLEDREAREAARKTVR